MKVLSLMEPWGSLIKEKVKYIETRSWKTNYRGDLYIHTSLKKIPKNFDSVYFMECDFLCLKILSFERIWINTVY